MGDEILYPFDKLDASKSRGREALELEGGTRKQPTNTPVILGADWKRRIRGEIEKFTPDSLLPRTRRRPRKRKNQPCRSQSASPPIFQTFPSVFKISSSLGY